MDSRKWAILLAKAAISATLLYLILRHISLEKLSGRLSDATLQRALLAFLPLVAVTFCVGFRWHVIASAVARPVRFLQAWAVSMIGAALDQVFVTMSGDAYRIWWLKKGSASLTHAIAGVLLDRVAGMLGIIFLVMLFMARFAQLDTQGSLVWVPLMLSAGMLCGFALLLVLDKAPFSRIRNRWFAGLAVLSASARRVFLTPGTAGRALAGAILVHVGICTTMTVIAWALGIDLPLAMALTVVPAVFLVSSLPLSIGGWGVREGAMVLALGLAGIESSDAFLISVTFGILAALMGLTGGILWVAGYPSARTLRIKT